METWDTLRSNSWQNWRELWLRETLVQIRPHLQDGSTLLDVGAGEAPYREWIEHLGFKYRSHDFAGYQPEQASAGFREDKWEYPELDFVSDIVDLPPAAKSDVILCTDVLEHVPDPVRALESMMRVCNPGGYIVILVPLNSLVHQAPYFFNLVCRHFGSNITSSLTRVLASKELQWLEIILTL